MVNPSYDPWDDIELTPQDTIDINKNKEPQEKDPWDALDFDEGFWKNAFRTVLQIPKGIAEATPYGIGSNLFQMLALGESDLGIEEWHKLRELAEQEGMQFDEEAYENARNEMLQSIPTVSNISNVIEEQTGLPLEAKTNLQKAVGLGSMGGKFQTGNISQKALTGAITGATKLGLEEVGAPEIVSDIGGLVIGGKLGGKIPAPEIQAKTKPSGLKERGFEGLTKPREVSESKLNKINENLKKDFTEISDKIIKESPIGETAKNLSENPTFKKQSRELLSEAQEIANSLEKETPKETIQASLISKAKKNEKGFKKNEYDKNYEKYMLEAVNESENATAGQLVEQYRKNNESLGEYFESGSSKALNRAKRDALLDENRAISDVIEKMYPESELHSVFKEGNDRWTKIMDAEAIDGFTNKVFEKGVNFKELNNFFDKTGYDRIFKRALGEEGFKEFSTLVQDMLTNQKPYTLLEVAKSKGYDDLFKTGIGYILHPKIGMAKAGMDIAKSGWKTLINSMLDKPKLFINWKNGVKDLKKGDFKAAEKEFKVLKGEIEEIAKPLTKTKESEVINVKTEKIESQKQEPLKNKEIEYKPIEKTESSKGNVKKQEALNKFNERKTKLTKEKSYFEKLTKEEKKKEIDSLFREDKKKSEPKVKKIVSKEDKKIKENKSKIKVLEERIQEAKDNLIYRSEVENYPQSRIDNINSTIKDFEKSRMKLLEQNETLKNPVTGNDLRQVTERQIKKDFITVNPESEKEVLEHILKLKKEKNKIKGRKKSDLESKQPYENEIRKSEKILTDLIKKRKQAEKSVETKSEVNRNKFKPAELKEQKDFVLKSIDNALKNPTDKEFVDIQIPGDGEFKIYNIEEVLNKFKDKVKKSYPTTKK